VVPTSSSSLPSADIGNQPDISVIIPVRNGAGVLGRCLEALRQSTGVSWECIVVDDGSSDASVAIARQNGARSLGTDHAASGPGRARNLGAHAAAAPLLCFLDADVVVRPDTLAQFAALFAHDPDLSAAFGSYDDQPGSRDLLSQYRNLLHHFVHQTGREEATTFWSGCGAIRRSAFLALGGFDPSFDRPSIEDIELGYRLHAAAARIRLAKHIQVKHLKHWTFWSILKTDIRDRALPWTALIQRTRYLPNDLNLQTAGRVSALSVFALSALLVLGVWHAFLWLACLAPLLTLLACNRDLYAFFLWRRSLWFLVRTLPMHWLYFAYSAVAFVLGMLYFLPTRETGARLPPDVAAAHGTSLSSPPHDVEVAV
jgi:glycosyltransferase involved in cell wall biosynthesis